MTRQALEHLAAWLDQGDPASRWHEALALLAQSYQAQGAGLVGPVPNPAPARLDWWDGDGLADSWSPWHDEDAMLQLQNRSGVHAFPDVSHSWLLATLGDVVAWVLVKPPRAFSAAEGALLPVAGYAIYRGLERSATRLPWITALEQTRRERDLGNAARLAAKMAHEFGNHLTGALGFAELALQQLFPDTLAHQFVGEVLQAAKQGAEWVYKLQTFSRRGSPRSAGCLLADVTAVEKQRARETWGEGYQLAVCLPEELPALGIDSAALQALVVELLDNARQAMENPGVVRLTAREVALVSVDALNLVGQPAPGAFVEITLSNPGRTLSPVVASGRLEEVLISSKRRRHGLGLAVAYGILKKYGGGMALEPRPEGGSIVRVFVPVHVRAAGHGPHAGTARILVVDDDPASRAAACAILTQAGYPAQAAGPREALALCSARPSAFQLIVSAVVMQYMNGLDLTRRLHESNPALNVLFMTGDGAMSDVATLPGSRYPLLRKPLDRQTLLGAVRAALDGAVAVVER
jgi:two-component system cell cycle sensor histidine kinase/response regulator CckA